jgi:hypothetical protein
MGDLAGRVAADGFAVVPSGVPDRLLADARDDVYATLGVSESDRRTWGSVDPRSRGFVPLWNSAALWSIRAQLCLRDVFAELWGTPDLWASVDRCHFKPPVSANAALGAQSFLHRDADRADPLFTRYQGVLALTDTPLVQGCFRCVPELFAPEDDLDHQPQAPDGFFACVEVGCRAGDLIVWDNRLLHGNSPNCGVAPRLAMYVAFVPAGGAEQMRRRTDSVRSGAWPHGPSRYPGFESANTGDYRALLRDWRPHLGVEPPATGPGAAR